MSLQEGFDLFLKGLGVLFLLVLLLLIILRAFFPIEDWAESFRKEDEDMIHEGHEDQGREEPQMDADER